MKKLKLSLLAAALLAGIAMAPGASALGQLRSMAPDGGIVTSPPSTTTTSSIVILRAVISHLFI